MNNNIKVFYISFFLLFKICIFSQISLSNSSFEGIPADATMPNGWYSASEGTTPDILPGYWGVYNEAFDGETYIGLITRQDGSSESIGQRLGKTLEAETCYQMSLRLSHSDGYSGYNGPLFLRIWISDQKTKRQQLIFMSPKLDFEAWKRFKFEFIPESDTQYIILEAFINDNPLSYKGNLLIDNISSIRICNKA